MRSRLTATRAARSRGVTGEYGVRPDRPGADPAPGRRRGVQPGALAGQRREAGEVLEHQHPAAEQPGVRGSRGVVEVVDVHRVDADQGGTPRSEPVGTVRGQEGRVDGVLGVPQATSPPVCSSTATPSSGTSPRRAASPVASTPLATSRRRPSGRPPRPAAGRRGLPRRGTGGTGCRGRCRCCRPSRPRRPGTRCPSSSVVLRLRKARHRGAGMPGWVTWPGAMGWLRSTSRLMPRLRPRRPRRCGRRGGSPPRGGSARTGPPAGRRRPAGGRPARPVRRPRARRHGSADRR